MSNQLLKQKRQVSKSIGSNNSNCRVVKPFSEDEIEFVLSKIGMYTIASIAKRLNRTRDSVVGVLKYRNILSFQERYKNGITPFALSREWQISHSNISYWIRNFDLPVILPDKNQKLGMAGQKPVRIINESALVNWWQKGYALINEIDPINIEKKRKLNEIRQHMYNQWIPTNAIADALYITHNHIAEMITAGKIVEPVFRYRGRAFLNRQSVYDWIRKNHGAKEAWLIANYRWDGIR
jgi:hypothetical protein